MLTVPQQAPAPTARPVKHDLGRGVRHRRVHLCQGAEGDVDLQPQRRVGLGPVDAATIRAPGQARSSVRSGGPGTRVRSALSSQASSSFPQRPLPPGRRRRSRGAAGRQRPTEKGAFDRPLIPQPPDEPLDHRLQFAHAIPKVLTPALIRRAQDPFNMSKTRRDPSHQPKTSSPGWVCVTLLPTAAMRPATSKPGTLCFGLRSP